MTFPINMRIFDSHSHLYLPDFDPDLQDVLQRAREAGVERIVNIGIDAQSSVECLRLAREYSGFYATVGWHPHDAKAIGKDDFLELERLAKDKDALAIGEIGLDFYRDHSPRDVQGRVFGELLDLAVGAGKPVVIHSRDAFQETSGMLGARKNELSGILIHCFGGTKDEASAYLDMGAYLSIPGTVTYKSAKALKEAVRGLPKDRVLIETDAPYLAPTPMRGKRNEPSFLTYHVKAIASLWGIGEEETAFLTFANASRFFGLDPS
jgi:TatD DNase family protein